MRRPGSVELGMAEPVVASIQVPSRLEVAQKSLAVTATVRQSTRVIEGAPERAGVKPLANPPAMKLAEETPLITTTVVISYTYDPLNRLTAADYDDGMYFHYTYDAVGNQLWEETNGWTNVYDYDDANRLIYANGVDYLWDDNGNLLSDGVYTYTYDIANRLVGVSGTGLAVSYSYNGLGDRLSETANELTTQYTMDLNAGLTQVLADSTNTYLYGADRIAQYGASEAEYFLGDALGSVRQLVDADGNLTLGRKYKPYGEVLAEAGDGATSYGFTGEWTDGSTEDVYLRSRWYSSETGRFLTKDSWQGDYTRPLSFNKWNYVESNPINLTDASGRNPAVLAILLPIVAGGAIGFVAGAAVGGVYGKCTYQWALAGECGCDIQQQALLMTEYEWIRTNALAAGIIGGVAGAISIAAPVGMIAVGVGGLLISGADFVNTVQIMKNETGLTWCTATRLLLDVAGIVFSGMGIAKGIKALGTSGSFLRWVKNQDIIWPPNKGFLGESKRITLMPGTRVDRYGYEGGTFVSPEGTPYEMRSLAPGSNLKPYNIYDVVKPVEVSSGIVAPWFGEPGMGIQYEFSLSISDLLSKGILKRVGP
jgi:RHS repeat-associated protein